MRRLVDLDDSRDPSGADPSIVGDKAARLARARDLGLPVLPGWVVPVREADGALRRGMALLRLGGSGAARLAVMDEVLDPGLAEDLEEALADLGTPVVARSSSPLEADRAWAGAFSSFHDIGPADVAVAVRGCWASAFSVDVLARAEATGVPVEGMGLAVLIQRQMDPTAGGTAAVAPDGVVTVETVQGSPAALVGGWERGARAVVGPDGSVVRVEGGRAVPQPAGLSWPSLLREVAEVLRRLHAGTGDDLIEWALAEEGVVLLQAGRAGGGEQREQRDSLAEEEPVPEGLESETALRAALLAQAYTGSVAEELVLPWACGTPGIEWPSVSEDGRCDPGSATAEAAVRAAVRDLTAWAWGMAPNEAGRLARAALAELRGPEPAAAIRRLGALRPVEDARARHVLAFAANLAATAPARLDPWGLFIRRVLRVHGASVRGTAAAPGIGAGLALVVPDPHALQGCQAGRGYVVVAPSPLPALAPLLWRTSALVTGTGGPAAHLVDVARSLRVPAVVSAPVEDLIGPLAGGKRSSHVLVVDGGTGVVSAVQA